jgi:hypothetical protein
MSSAPTTIYHYSLYCKSYGGFGYSDEAVREYIARMQKIDPHFQPPVGIFAICARDDPVMLRVVCDLGKTANGDFCEFGIVAIDSKYAACLNIHEYDGKETPYFDAKRYFRCQVRDICDKNTETDSSKIVEIKKLLDGGCANDLPAVVTMEISEFAAIS